jgi:hypothetical protein
MRFRRRTLVILQNDHVLLLCALCFIGYSWRVLPHGSSSLSSWDHRIVAGFFGWLLLRWSSFLGAHDWNCHCWQGQKAFSGGESATVEPTVLILAIAFLCLESRCWLFSLFSWSRSFFWTRQSGESIPSARTASTSGPEARHVCGAFRNARVSLSVATFILKPFGQIRPPTHLQCHHSSSLHQAYLYRTCKDLLDY